MTTLLNGIHHVTAIAGDPQKNLDFYTGALGLRLVKRTVNFDDPFTYHFYFGDRSGAPGTILTFFPWSAAARVGHAGTGQASRFSFSLRPGSLGFWLDRFTDLSVPVEGPFSRFGQNVVVARDHDGFEIELVERSGEIRPGTSTPDVPEMHALRGFHSVTLPELSARATIEFLRQAMGFRVVGSEGNRTRLATGWREDESFLDIVDEPRMAPATMGRGAIHHVAFRTDNDSSQLAVRRQLVSDGVRVTPVADRRYFTSIYFHEPGGFLFEIATDSPGFASDETPETLGLSLRLPPWLENQRTLIEAELPFIDV